MSAPPDPADPGGPTGRHRGLSVMATLQLIFLLQTAALMGYMPFLQRCEPRGPQRKMRRKSFEEISDNLSNRFFVVYTECIGNHSTSYMLNCNLS